MLMILIIVFNRYPIICCGSFGFTYASIPISICWAKFSSLQIVIFMVTGGTLQTLTCFGDHGTCQFIVGLSGIVIECNQLRV